MVKNSDWAPNWLAELLRNDKKRYRVQKLSTTHLKVTRSNMNDVIICATSTPVLNAESLMLLLDEQPEADFFATTSKETVIQESAYSLARERGVAIGRVGDLLNALELDAVRDYVDKDVHYVEQKMSQHIRITSFERIGYLMYEVTTKALGEQRVAFFNEYELTADILRRARADHGFFDLAVNWHCAGSATTQAFQVATDIGAEILTWSEFFSRMHCK